MLQTIIQTIANFGWIQFGLAVLVDILLWSIHPVLGFLGALFLFAVIAGII